MQVSYSRISTHEKCPYQFKLHYVDKLETIFNCDPQSALILGHALHTGIEKDVKEAIKEYYSAYPIVKDAHVTEAMKLEYLIPKVKAALPKGEHEIKIETPDFVGYIDLLTPVNLTLEEKDAICESCINCDSCGYVNSGQCPCYKYEDYYDLYDFKYSNNVTGYMESRQLHLYKYFFELINPGKRIRNLYFVFVPKCMLKQKYANKTNKRDETIYEFRKRCMKDLESKEIQIKEVKYDPAKVIEYLIATKHCIEDTEYIKKPTRLCDWCEFQQYCEKGIDYMILPENKRREKVLNTTPDMWIYADSYVGKSTFIDQLDDLIFANTDGNVENITSPVVRIKNEIIKNGRMTETKLAWEVFLEFVEELEKKENNFKVIAIDLIEDLYEHCRLYMYDKLGIEHEQDAGFGKGWDMVRTEFLSTIKRLKNLGYRIIYISKEIKNEVNLKNGAKITSYAPNIADKVANVLAGTVTLTVRAYMNNRGRFLQLAKEENIFGGGRFDFVNATCPLNMDAFIKELKLAQTVGSTAESSRGNKSSDSSNGGNVSNDDDNVSIDNDKSGIVGDTEKAEVPTRKRRASKTDEAAETETTSDGDVSETAEPAPVKRTRKKRGE